MNLAPRTFGREHLPTVSDRQNDLYAHDINMYETPPMSDISRGEFERITIHRLRVLKILQFASSEGHKMFGTEWKDCIYGRLLKANLVKFLLLIQSKGTTSPNDLHLYKRARRVDHISHFVLRLAYCHSDQARNWFANMELVLFQLRFMELSERGRSDFLKVYKLHYPLISEDEKRKYFKELSESTDGSFAFDDFSFYKVHFTEALSLVQKRSVFVHGGYAYVPNFELVSVISQLFNKKMKENLLFASRKLPVMLRDERLKCLIAKVHKIYDGVQFDEEMPAAFEVSISDLDNLAQLHYPLCMQHIHKAFKREHHLKHFSRLQYLIFLQGIGLSLENCLKFWKYECTRKNIAHQFDKKYDYSIKHVYGQVGRKKKHAIQSCEKIIGNTPGPNEHHGCPFKNLDSESLTKMMCCELKMHSTDIEDIVEPAKNNQYQVACGKFFEHTHGQKPQKIISHPNQYFTDSYNCREGVNIFNSSSSDED